MTAKDRKKKSATSKERPKNNLASMVQELSQLQKQRSDEIMKELVSVKSEMDQMKEWMSRLKVVQPRRRGGILARRRIPVQVVENQEMKKTKPTANLQDLLPLLPQLQSVMPQLNNGKVSEAVKVLSNPAVAGMLQQFLSGAGKKRKTLTPRINNHR